MKVQTPETLIQAASLTEDDARELLESIRWPDGAVCPHCGEFERVKIMGGKATRPGLYKCYACRKQFTVTVGTIMHRSHITLKQWVLAFYSICSHKKGVSALQLQRDLGLGSYKSAWHLAHRIRCAMQESPLKDLLSGVVEVDETYVGGRGWGGKRGRGSQSKTPVVAICERDGRMASKSIKNASRKTLYSAIQENVGRESTIMTDEWPSYRGIGEHFNGGHQSVQHSKGEYARGQVHVNSCESFFGLLKRGVHGTFHHVSRKHIDRYCVEFSFRWNFRKTTDGQRALMAMKLIGGKRLMYCDLIGEA